MLRKHVEHIALVYKLALAVCVGFTLAMVASPSPKTNADCSVYKINPKTVTSYILKPPPAPAAEPQVCPVAPKCEPQVSNEQFSVSKTEASNGDEGHKRRHHRRHRVRAYWN